MVQSETNSSTLQPGPGTSNDFNLVDAMSADHAEGCEEGKEWGAGPTKAAMGGIGYLLGGFDLPGTGIFDH